MSGPNATIVQWRTSRPSGRGCANDCRNPGRPGLCKRGGALAPQAANQPRRLRSHDAGQLAGLGSPSTRAEAKRCFERAIELDPEYALPHSLLAMILRLDWQRGIAGSPALLDRAFALAKRGVELSAGESTSHVAMGFLYLERRCFDLALKHMEHAVEINPANPTTKADLGVLLSQIGRAEEALASA